MDMKTIDRTLAGTVLCFLALLSSCTRQAVISKDGTCLYTIVYSQSAAPAELTAVRQLSEYIGRITGETPQAVTDETPAANQREIVVGKTGRDIPRVETCRDTLGGEGFAIIWDGPRVYVTGSGQNNGRGTLYGAFELLRDFGCEFYAADTETVPDEPSLTVERRDRVEKPVFEYRDVYWSAVWDKGISTKLHRNGNLAGQLPLDWGGGVFYAGPHFVHSFDQLVPPDKYFASHPEYFSEINGERTCKHLYSQLCMTNEDVFDIALSQASKDFLGFVIHQPDFHLTLLNRTICPEHKQDLTSIARKHRSLGHEQGIPALQDIDGSMRKQARFYFVTCCVKLYAHLIRLGTLIHRRTHIDDAARIICPQSIDCHLDLHARLQYRRIAFR